MLQNYITTIFRGIRRNKFFTLINLFGLSVAMACFIIVGLYVNYELSYDKFHDSVEDIHIVKMKFSEEMGGFSNSFVPAVLAEEIANKIPSVEHATVTASGAGNIMVKATNGEFLAEKYYQVENSFFDIFSFPMLYGDATKALSEPTSVVISSEMALKYFNNENAMGKLIAIEGKGEFKVSGVLKPFPKNSQFQPHFLLSFNGQNTLERRTSWGMNGYFVYIKTLPGTDLETLKTDIWKLYDNRKIDGTSYVAADLEAFGDTYWSWSGGGASLNNRSRGLGANKSVIYVCSGLAILLLFIALANYVNMATAKAVERAKEVGIRKVNGATRGQLRVQFLGETIVFALMSLVFSMILVEMILPSVSEVLGISLKVDYTNLNWLLVLFGYAVLCGVVAGLYPALFLSRFNPVKAIKGELSTGNKRFSPKVILLFLQFTISSTLIVVLLVANAQIRHYLNFDLGFDKDQVVSLYAPPQLRTDAQSVFNQVKSVKGVVSATRGSMPYGGDGSARITYQEKKLGNITKVHVDEQFLPLFDIALLAGRNFDANRPEDFQNAMIINKAFADKMDVEDPVNELVDLGGTSMRVIGVMDNFFIGGALSTESPLFLFPSKNSFTHVLVKIEGGDPSETLAAFENIWRPYNGKAAFKYQFLDEAYAAKINDLQRITLIVNGITIAIVVLSLFGLFSLVVYHTSRKLKDIGIRKILGASSAHILMILGKPYLGVLLVSAAVALPLSYYFMGGVLEQYPNKIDLNAQYGVVAILSIVVLSAMVILSRAVSASRTNPVDILRNE